MRTIKFRAWNNKYNEWTIPDQMGVTFNAEVFMQVGEQNFCMNPEIIMLEQFTGLLDRNGKEIYEGDVLETYVSSSWDVDVIIRIKGVVILGDPFPGCFCFKESDNTCCLYELCGESFGGEIIGNIHDNPELIK